MSSAASTTVHPISAAVMPIRRDLDFDLPAERIGDWHPTGPQTSHFFNAMSLFFPHGERFFIHSVRNYRDQIADPQLQQAVKAFIGQEAMHGREHEDYNGLMAQAGLPAAALEDRVYRLLEWVKAHVSARRQLAATIALEHLTAIMADIVLRDERVVGGAVPQYRNLWRWHALEETEHKAVAFDVWTTVTKPTLLNYLLRCFALVTATSMFFTLVVKYHRQLVKADPVARAEKRGGWKAIWFTLGTPGALRRAIPAWFDWFKPGFHPWQHDNRRYLTEIDTLVKDVSPSLPIAA
jgi:predicted metal-dependent hydrolase